MRNKDLVPLTVELLVEDRMDTLNPGKLAGNLGLSFVKGMFSYGKKDVFLNL